MDEDEVAAGRASSEPLTVYVKNLSFATDEAGLRSCFEKAGLNVRSVSIPRKKGPGASEAKLSMGFGFVECADKCLVEKALQVRSPHCFCDGRGVLAPAWGLCFLWGDGLIPIAAIVACKLRMCRGEMNGNSLEHEGSRCLITSCILL